MLCIDNKCVVWSFGPCRGKMFSLTYWYGFLLSVIINVPKFHCCSIECRRRAVGNTQLRLANLIHLLVGTSTSARRAAKRDRNIANLARKPTIALWNMSERGILRDFLIFFLKKTKHCFLIRKRVFIFALDFSAPYVGPTIGFFERALWGICEFPMKAIKKCR